MSTDPARVILCWMSSEDVINSISYGRPQCVTRTYEKDAYDPRAGNNLPFFDSASKAFAYMKENRGLDGICQVEVGKATWALGFDERDLDL